MSPESSLSPDPVSTAQATAALTAVEISAIEESIGELSIAYEELQDEVMESLETCRESLETITGQLTQLTAAETAESPTLQLVLSKLDSLQTQVATLAATVESLKQSPAAVSPSTPQPSLSPNPPENPVEVAAVLPVAEPEAEEPEPARRRRALKI